MTQQPVGGSTTPTVAVGAVLALFAFLAAFFAVSDRLGGWPLGYAISVGLGIVVFLIFFRVASIVGRKAGKRNEVAPSPQSSVVVQTPVEVNVPVHVTVERETFRIQDLASSTTKQSTPVPAAGVAPEGNLPRGKPTQRPEQHQGGEDVIFDSEVEVLQGRSGAWHFELPLAPGETLEGSLREVDGEKFNWMIVRETDYLAFLNGENPEHVAGEEDVKATPIKWKVTRKGRWCLVLDAYGKWYTRNVHVALRRVRDE